MVWAAACTFDYQGFSTVLSCTEYLFDCVEKTRTHVVAIQYIKQSSVMSSSEPTFP